MGLREDIMAYKPNTLAGTNYSFLDGDNNDVTYMCIFPFGATQHLDTLNATRARIIGNFQVGFYLDHLLFPLSVNKA